MSRHLLAPSCGRPVSDVRTARGRSRRVVLDQEPGVHNGLSDARPAIFRQGAWALVDQILSSATNFAMAIIVARLLPPKGYGSFALAIAAWLTLLGLVRAALVHPYVVAAARQG